MREGDNLKSSFKVLTSHQYNTRKFRITKTTVYQCLFSSAVIDSIKFGCFRCFLICSNPSKILVEIRKFFRHVKRWLMIFFRTLMNCFIMALFFEFSGSRLSHEHMKHGYLVIAPCCITRNVTLPFSSLHKFPAMIFVSQFFQNLILLFSFIFCFNESWMSYRYRALLISVMLCT